MKEQLKKDIYHQLSIEESKTLKQSIMENVEFVNVLPKEEKRIFKMPWQWITSFACCAMIIFSLVFNMRPMAVVAVDVNPAIELKVNKNERVIEIVLHNEQAQMVVGDMDLHNVDIEVAIHAIIGKMFQQGYLTNAKNTMLLTVQSDDITYRKQLKDMLVRDIETSYQMYDTPIALLSQELNMHSHYQKLAQQYNISEGKASLIMEMIEGNSNYQFENFVKMSIQDIQTLVHYKDIAYQSITAQGVESHEGYLTIDELKEIVSKHSNTTIIDFEYELDCDDNRLVYEVEFTDGLAEYDYEINAISGEVIKFTVELYDFDD